MKLCKKIRSRKKKLHGKGLINQIINKLPVELHVPGYQFCGPGTKLKDKLNKTGINPLDSACKEHDLFYSLHPNTEDRHQADLILQQKAAARAKAVDATFGERLSANIVKNTMKIKRALGAGIRRKKGGALKKRAKKYRGTGIKRRRGAGLKRTGGKKSIRGGYLLPLIATALGAVNSYSNFKNAKKAFALQKQQNENLEKIIKGKGMFLKPYRGGGRKRGFRCKGRRRTIN